MADALAVWIFFLDIQLVVAFIPRLVFVVASNANSNTLTRRFFWSPYSTTEYKNRHARSSAFLTLVM